MPDSLSVPIIKSSPPIIKPVSPFQDYSGASIGTFPSVPSSVYDSGTKKVSEGDLLSVFLSKGTSQQAKPLYDYTTQQETRYDNPFLQFTPNIQGSFSTEDVYGKKQGAGEQLWNSLLKTGVIAGATFISGFTSIPKQIDEIRKGNLFEDSAFTQTQEWLKGIEDTLPNYMTQVEQDRSWIINAFTPTGAANFWGDTILKNSGFIIGALANAVVIDSAISVLSGGSATPLALIDAGRKLSQAITPLKNAYRALSKASALGKADEVINGVRMAGTLSKSVALTNSASNIKNAAQLLLTTYGSAQGEAMIEGYQTYIDTKTKLLEEAYTSGNFTPERLKAIEETATGAGKSTALINGVLVGASNLMQFPRILGLTKNTELLEKASSKFLSLEKAEDGLRVASNWTKKKAVLGKIKAVGASVFSEGFEEGSQYFIGNTLHDYYVDKFNSKTKDDMGDYMLKAIPKTLVDENFWHEAVIGGISGGLMGAVMPGSELRKDWKESTQAYNSNLQTGLQTVIDRFNSGVSSMVDFDESMTLEGYQQKQASYKSLNRSIQDAIKFGALDILKENMEDLKTVDTEEYNKMFGTSFKSDLEKNTHVQRIQNEIDKVENDSLEIAKSFKNNPFASSRVAQVIKEKFKLPEEQTKNIQEQMFREWKENQTYLLGRLRNTTDHVEDLTDQLRLGANVQNTEDFEILKATLMTIEDNEVFSSYLAFKNRTIEALRVEDEYYKELKDNVNGAKVKKRLKEITDFYNKVEKAHTSKDFEKVKDLMFEEEFSMYQKFQISEQLEELKKTEEIKKNSEQELVQTNLEPEKSAELMVDVTKELEHQEEVENPPTQTVSDIEVPEMGFWQYNELRKINPGSIVELNNRQLTILTNDKTIITTKEGISITPKGVVINGVTEPFTDLKIIQDSSLQTKKSPQEAPKEDSIEEIKPKSIKPVQPKTKSKEPETDNSLKEIELFLLNNIGEEVTINNRSGKLVQFSNDSFGLEKDGDTAYTFYIDSVYSFLLKEKPKQEQEKYSITILSEEEVVVNNVKYKINVNTLGNVESLTPVNNLSQKIKNNNLILKVEIERNKMVFLKDNLQEDTKVVENLQKDFSFINIKLGEIWGENLTDSIAKGLNKLYEEKELTDSEKLNISIWLSDVFYKLTLEITNNSNRRKKEFLEVLLKAYDTATIINNLLYQNTKIKVTKNEKITGTGATVTQVENNESSIKSKKEIIREGEQLKRNEKRIKEIENTLKEKPQETKEELPQQEVQEDEEIYYQGQDLFNSFETSEITKTPNNIGGNYMIVGTQFSEDKPFFIYKLVSEGVYRKISIDPITGQGTMSDKKIKFEKEYEFYSINGEKEIVEPDIDTSIQDSLNVENKKEETNIEEKEKETQKEKSEKFINSIENQSVKSVILSALQRNIISLDC